MSQILFKHMLTFAVLALAVSACGTPGPQSINLGNRPMEQTAVVGNADYTNGTIFVHAVNGSKTDCLTLGCPRVIRIASGPTKLQVSFSVPARGAFMKSTGELVYLEEFEAKPGHTYFLRSKLNNNGSPDSVRIWVEDGGINQPIPKDILPGL